MQKKPVAKNGSNAHAVAAILRTIPLAELEPSSHNARKQFSKENLANLAESIRRHGVLQPVLVRKIAAPKAGKAKYQLIAGERRWRAAKLAGLKELPAHVRSMNDDEASSAGLVENLQREDIHPLDEADGYLRLKDEMKLGVRQIAARVAKDARYVARRLALTNLIEEARADLRGERITLAHALELCRLAPEVQTEALAACYETTHVFNRSANTYEYVPDKKRPARHVGRLQEWIVQNVHLDLKKAPFRLDDARLREDGLTCLHCPQRTGHDRTLFADVRSGDQCLNRGCFQAKLGAFVQITKLELETKTNKPAIFISAFYGSGAEGKEAIGRDQYQVIAKKADRCEFAEAAVAVDGGEIGQVKWVCPNETCKDHLGRVRESYAHTDASGAAPASSDNRNQRKQELFDIRVDEVARKRVMKEAVKTFAWPLERAHLNEAIKEFFRRIPNEHQQAICEVFGWDEDEAGKLRRDETAMLRKLAALGDTELAQFLMLCSFAHYGANQYKSNRVDQTLVAQLSKERGVNHVLIDAQVRAELCPKKYRAAHQTYLAAIEGGKTAKKPVVYEKQQPTTVATQTGKKKKHAAGKARAKAQTA